MPLENHADSLVRAGLLPIIPKVLLVFATINFMCAINASVIPDSYIPKGFPTTAASPNVIGLQLLSCKCVLRKCIGAERPVRTLWQEKGSCQQYVLNTPLSLVLFLLYSGTLWEFWTRPLARWRCMMLNCSTCSHCSQVGPSQAGSQKHCVFQVGWTSSSLVCKTHFVVIFKRAPSANIYWWPTMLQARVRGWRCSKTDTGPVPAVLTDLRSGSRLS